MSGKKIRFGYALDFRNPPQFQQDWHALYEGYLEFASWCETAGFGGIWIAEHHGVEDGYMPSPVTMAAAIAARTKTIRIGTGIAQGPFYHPVRLAEDAAVVDIISNGRFELAIGIGYRQEEADAYGLQLKERGVRTDELLQIVRRLFAGETVTFDGRYHRISNAKLSPMPVQPGGVPLQVGGFSRPGVRRAARYGDGYFGVAELYGMYREELDACGRDPGAMTMGGSELWMVVSHDPEQAVQEVGPYFLHQVNSYAKWDSESRGAPFQELTLDDLKASGQMLSLTPEQAIAHIRSKQAIAPLDTFTMMVPSGLPVDLLQRYAGIFATEVIPAFREG